MELDVDVLISIFEKYSVSRNKSEIDEQDDAAPAASSGGGGGSTSSVPKWSDLYTIKRGKANMLGKGGEKWQTGLTRGLANQIW
jgi:hypothetical protein